MAELFQTDCKTKLEVNWEKSRHNLEKSTCEKNLAYADDILIISNNIESPLCLVEAMTDVFAKFALKINFKKTKFMSILLDNINTTVSMQIKTLETTLTRTTTKISKKDNYSNDDKNTSYNNKNNTNDNNNNDSINKNNKNDNRNKRPDATATLSIGDDNNLEEVTQFKYLASILSSDNSVIQKLKRELTDQHKRLTLSRLV